MPETTVHDLVQLIDRARKALTEAGRPELAKSARVTVTAAGHLNLAYCTVTERVARQDAEIAKFLDLDAAFKATALDRIRPENTREITVDDLVQFVDRASKALIEAAPELAARAHAVVTASGQIQLSCKLFAGSSIDPDVAKFAELEPVFEADPARTDPLRQVCQTCNGNEWVNCTGTARPGQIARCPDCSPALAHRQRAAQNWRAVGETAYADALEDRLARIRSNNRVGQGQQRPDRQTKTEGSGAGTPEPMTRNPEHPLSEGMKGN